jgi:hypothetical protein
MKLWRRPHGRNVSNAVLRLQRHCVGLLALIWFRYLQRSNPDILAGIIASGIVLIFWAFGDISQPVGACHWPKTEG